MTVTAYDLYNYTKCPHRVYLDANRSPQERSEASPFVRLLWEMGLQAEREYLDALGHHDFVDLQPLPFDQACEQTAQLMSAGVDLVFQAAIRTGDWVGRPDLLVKHTDACSRFGHYYYEPIDIKAGKGWEEREGKRIRFKQHYAFQILFYREILKRIQGYVPPSARIVNVNKEIEEFDPTSFADAFELALGDVERLITGQEASEPVLGSACHQCHWYTKCRRWVEGTRDPSGLYFVGKVKFDLKRVGLKTIHDIADMEVDNYLAEPKKIAGMGRASLSRMKERARVMLQGEPVIRSGYAFPGRSRAIYFDVEDDPTRNLTYLYGCLVRESSGEERYEYFFAHTPEEELEVARAFWEFLAQAEDTVFYVYSPKERTSLRRMMERYELDSAVYERYLEREFDLYGDLVVKYSDWPTYSYGIKQIARLVGFEWRDPDPSGANSIVWYNEYIKSPFQQEILQRILDYNEDDCRAMVVLRDYFDARVRGVS
ncbi:MAG: TM0106 family RecB-like putative nuclease [Acidiferrobacterales bacterium]